MSKSNILDVRYARYGDNLDDPASYVREGPQQQVRLEVRLKAENISVRLNADPYRFGFMTSAKNDPELKRILVEQAIREMVRYFEGELRQALVEEAAIKNPRPLTDAF